MSSSPTPPLGAPERSAAQRREALALANKVRSERAQLKRDLKRGEVSIAELLREPPGCLASAKVMDLLRALPGYGPAKTARLLTRCRVSPSKSMAGLTERQREALIAALEK